MVYNLLYIYLLFFSVSFFVCLYPINVKTAEPIRQNYKNLFVKILVICKIWKSANFLFCLILYKEKMLTDRATIKS